MKKLITSFFILSLLFGGPVLAKIKPNDPFYVNEWYLQKIKADSAWEKVSESPDIVIAVIDSGVQINHPDLQQNIWRNEKEIASNGHDDDRNGFIDDVNGWDFVNNLPDPSPKFMKDWTEAGVSHGTMVAGIMAAAGDNEQGVAGLTWRAKIMSLKVLNDKGEGRVSDVVRAVDYATNNGADIINLSFVSFNYSKALQEAIKRAHNAGVIIVAAAGNEQAAGEGYNIDKTPIYPACYDGDLGENMVIGVAATDALDQKAKFSSYGTHCVDLTAPGISFFSTVTLGSDPVNPDKYYNGYWSGTSFATPLVSGALALIMQANPELSRREVVNILFASTSNINRLNPDYPDQLGNGRLNVDLAVSLAKEKLYSRMGRLLIMPVSGKKDWKLVAANGDLVNNFKTMETKNGFSIAAGDVNNDNSEEVILGAPANQEPQVRVYNKNGQLIKQFLAFDKKFRGGLNLTVADIDSDNQAEILIVPASNGLGQVRIFDGQGKLKKQISVMGKNWRGGLNIASGDIDGKDDQEIVIGLGAGQEPQIKIFTTGGKLISAFLAYEKNFRGGVKIAVANINGRASHNRAEIIAAPGRGREPLIKIFDNYAKVKKQFLAYKKNWQNGFSLAVGDINNDGLPEIATGANPGAAPHVRIFDGQGGLLESFYTWEESFNGGVNLGIIKINN
ncbi:MAG: S8 family serine peptidase [Patescibacteria group bacterium]|jgi:subtilisin family serine protease